jgi:hypothetical protein
MGSQHEPLFTKCMAACGYFTHSISSYRCICTTMKCLNCSYNLCIETTHILLNMIKESKTFNLIRVLKFIFLWHLLYPHFRKILTKRIANNFFTSSYITAKLFIPNLECINSVKNYVYTQHAIRGWLYA